MLPYQAVFKALADIKGKDRTSERHQYLSKMLNNQQLLELMEHLQPTDDSKLAAPSNKDRERFPFATQKGNTLLHMACHQDNWELLEDLLNFHYERNDDNVYPFVDLINLLDTRGETVCHYLVKANEVRALERIFEKFAFQINPFVVNNEGKTLCEVADYGYNPTDSALGNIGMVRLLARQQCFVGTTLTDLGASITEDMDVLALGSFLSVDSDRMPHTHLVHHFDDHIENYAAQRQLTDHDKRLYSHRLRQAFNELSPKRLVVMASYEQFVAVDGSLLVCVDIENIIEFNSPSKEALERPLQTIAALSELAKLQRDLVVLLHALTVREGRRYNIRETTMLSLLATFLVAPLVFFGLASDISMLYWLFAKSGMSLFDSFWDVVRTIVCVPIFTVFWTLISVGALSIAGTIIYVLAVCLSLPLILCIHCFPPALNLFRALDSRLNALEQAHDLDITTLLLRDDVWRLSEGGLLRELLVFLRANEDIAEHYRAVLDKALDEEPLTFAKAKELVESLQSITGTGIVGAEFLEDETIRVSLQDELAALSSAKTSAATSSASVTAITNPARYPRVQFDALRQRYGQEGVESQELQEVVVEGGAEEDALLEPERIIPGYGAAGTQHSS